jgi:hypothetical protein
MFFVALAWDALGVLCLIWLASFWLGLTSTPAGPRGALAATTTLRPGDGNDDHEEDDGAVLKLVMPATAAELEERNAAPGRLPGVRR